MEFSYYNAAVDLTERNLTVERAGRIAIIDESGLHTYAELAERVNLCSNALRQLGIQAEQRVLLCLYDTIDFAACFLGAIKAGIMPVPINTMWSAADYAYVLSDSRARAAIVSEERLPAMLQAAQISGWTGQIVVAGNSGGAHLELSALIESAAPDCEAYPARPDDTCSGSIPPVQLDVPRPRYTSRPAWRGRRSSMARPCSASTRTTSFILRQSCSSPTGWEMR